MTVPDEHKNCVKGSRWEGEPAGDIVKLGDLDAYKSGDDAEVAILLIHDAFGWTFKNLRLLADHYARVIGATVWMPDFFEGETLDADILVQGPQSQAWKTIDFAGFGKRQHRTIREPAIFEAARLLRSQYQKLGAVGYCFGGWAVFRLGAQLVVDGTVREYEQAKGTAGATPLVDAVSAGHPTWLTKADIDGVRVPTQILAPERDGPFNPELKAYALKVLPTLGIELDYRYFPGFEHGFISRGSLDEPGERQACERAKRSISSWFIEILKT